MVTLLSFNFLIFMYLSNLSIILINTMHGGPNNADNSGVLSYVRVEFAGYVGESVKHFNPEFVRGCLAVKIHD